MTVAVTAAAFSADRSPTVFVHERALVESHDIGPGDADLGVRARDAWRADRRRAATSATTHYVKGDVIVGDRVTIKSGVYLWDGLRVEDDVFLGPHATFTNDRFPRSKQVFDCPITTIRRGASIGAGAVILPGITVGERAMVGAGAVATRMPGVAMVVGNPARVVRTLDPRDAHTHGPNPISCLDPTKG
jgi:UDP-2-acetamido-3-amino-2,3-dideoxy-glucuronate N-acetyltransferase